MFGWLKRLFGKDSVDTFVEQPLVLETEQRVEETKAETEVKTDNAALNEVVKTPKAKKAKKKVQEDFDSMNKKDLLTLCKERGVKANASLKKEELIARLNAR